MFYNVIRGILIVLSKIIFRVSYEGQENIPAEGGYIVASNHHSLIDPVFLIMGQKRHIYFMAKAELFKNGFLSWLFTKMGAFPVARGHNDSTAVQHSVDIVKRGDLLGIFPEGTRSKDGALGSPRSGAAFIARGSGCGVIPCAVIFEGSLKMFKKVHVKYGMPIAYENLGFGEDEKASLKKVSKRIMSEISVLITPPEDVNA